MRKIENALGASMPGSAFHESVKSMRMTLEAKLAEEERKRKEQEEFANRLAPGKLAPPIEMNDANGKLLPLSSLNQWKITSIIIAKRKSCAYRFLGFLVRTMQKRKS